MKKIITLMLAAGLVFSAATNASAVDVKVSGMFDFAFEGYQNLDTPFMDSSDVTHNWGSGDSHQKSSGAVQRIRLGVEFIASESLSAYYEAQIGTFTWGGPQGGGNEQAGGVLGGRSSNISTRYAYLDWIVPNTNVKVRMGQQPLSVPFYTFNSPVLDDSGTGIVVSIPVNDNITVTPLWVRAASDNRRANAGTIGRHRDDNSDVFGLIADFSYDGFSVTPWALYVSTGKHVNSIDGASFVSNLVPSWYSEDFGGSADTWMAGIGGELTKFDPFRFTADFYYGSTDGKSYDSPAGRLDNDRAGWYAALGGEYKLPAYGVLSLRGWYASGDDKDISDGSERAPSLAPSFNGSSTFFDGAFSIARNYARTTADGTWGISLGWKDISFINKLSHDISVTYVKGTNSDKLVRNAAAFNAAGYDAFDGPWSYLTKKDSLIEVDFNSTYDIYQNLAAVLELAYVWEDFSGSTWGTYWGSTDNKARFSDSWRAALNFRYSF